MGAPAPPVAGLLQQQVQQAQQQQLKHSLHRWSRHAGWQLRTCSVPASAHGMPSTRPTCALAGGPAPCAARCEWLAGPLLPRQLDYPWLAWQRWLGRGVRRGRMCGRCCTACPAQPG